MSVRVLQYTAAALAALALAAGYALLEMWAWTVGAVALGVLLAWGLRRGIAWMATAGGVGLLVVLLTGAGSGLPLPLMLLAALGLLAAWDLTRLFGRLRLLPSPEAAERYTIDHLKLLGGVLAAALVLGLAVTAVDLRLSFAWIAGLVVLALVLVRLAVSLLTRWE